MNTPDQLPTQTPEQQPHPNYMSVLNYFNLLIDARGGGRAEDLFNLADILEARFVDIPELGVADDLAAIDLSYLESVELQEAIKATIGQVQQAAQARIEREYKDFSNIVESHAGCLGIFTDGVFSPLERLECVKESGEVRFAAVIAGKIHPSISRNRLFIDMQRMAPTLY